MKEEAAKKRKREKKEGEDEEERKQAKDARENEEFESNQPTVVKFICNICYSKVPSTRKAFKKGQLDGRTWCGTCHKSHMIKAFNCACGVAWYKCSNHNKLKEMDGGEKPHGSKKRLEQKASLKRPRKTQEDLEGLLLRRNKSKLTHQEPLVLRRNMLSEGLKRKFAHLFD